MGTSALLLNASNKSAGASDDSDVPAAATLQARSFASALTYSAEAPDPRPGSCIAGLPARGPWSVAGGSSCGSTVHAAPGLPCPRWHTQAVKSCYGSDESSRLNRPSVLSTRTETRSGRAVRPARLGFVVSRRARRLQVCTAGARTTAQGRRRWSSGPGLWGAARRRGGPRWSKCCK